MGEFLEWVSRAEKVDRVLVQGGAIKRLQVAGDQIVDRSPHSKTVLLPHVFSV